MEVIVFLIELLAFETGSFVCAAVCFFQLEVVSVHVLTRFVRRKHKGRCSLAMSRAW